MINERTLYEKLEDKAFSIQIKKGIKEPSTFDAITTKFSILDIKNIADELARENNNGWIPIENGFPKDGTRVYVTCQTKQGSIGMQDCWYTHGVFKIYADLEPFPDDIKVIAWKEEIPYAPKEKDITQDLEQIDR